MNPDIFFGILIGFVICGAINSLFGRKTTKPEVSASGPPWAIPGSPAPMPSVSGAVVCMKEATQAAARGAIAWNKSQVRDAIRSTRTFIDEAEAALESAESTTKEESTNG